MDESGVRIHLGYSLKHFGFLLPAYPRVQLQEGCVFSISRGFCGHGDHTIRSYPSVLPGFLWSILLILMCRRQQGPMIPRDNFVQVHREEVAGFVLGLRIVIW